jgi:hypothetical protein
MPRYRVVLKGLADNSPEGRKSFVAKFAQGFKVTEQAAVERIRRQGGLISAYDDEATANKARDFLIRIGGKSVVEAEVPVPPAAPPDLGDESSGPTVTFKPMDQADPAPPPAGPPEIDFDSPGAGAEPSSSGGTEMELESAADSMGAVVAASQAPEPEPAPARPAGGVQPCPKCGYPAPEGQDECPSCHVFISKFRKAQERKTQAAAPPDLPAPAAPRPGVPSAYAYNLSGPPAAPAEKQTVPEASSALVLGLIGLLIPICGFFAVSRGLKAAKIVGQNPDQLQGAGMAAIGIFLGFFDIGLWTLGYFFRARLLGL